MKDKKSIAIVVLAAITAGIGIFTIVNNQSKLSAYDDLEKKHSDVTDERKSLTQKLQTMTAARDALDNEGRQLKSDLGVTEQKVQTLSQSEVDLKASIQDNDLKFVEDLGKKDAEIKAALENLEKKAQELVDTETVLLKVQADATATAGELETAQKALGNAQQALKTEKDAFEKLEKETTATIEEGKKMIVELESKYDNLNQEKGALEEKIKNLNLEIEKVTGRLNDSEGDRVFLERELVRLQGEKTELVKKMNDMNYISAQYKAIKDELNTAKREDWMRRGVGIYAKRKTILERNAELRGKKPEVVAVAQPTLPKPDKISVELTSDGKVKINGKIIEPEETDPKPETKIPETPKSAADVSNPVAPEKVSSQD